MKKLMLMISAMTLALGINFTASADAGWATQAGPLVNCTYNDGTTDYVPTMICTYEGGTFVRNWGYQN